MSFPAVVAALGVRDDRLEIAEKFLLVVLGSYVGPDLTCFPSQKRLAEDMGATDRSIRTYLARLEALGYIARCKRRANGKQTSDLLTLRMQPETISARGRFQAENNVVSGGKIRPFQAETVSYEPVIESRTKRAREDRDDEASSRALVAEGMRKLLGELQARRVVSEPSRRRLSTRRAS